MASSGQELEHMEVDENVESDATVGDSDVESDASGSILNIPSSPEVSRANSAEIPERPGAPVPYTPDLIELTDSEGDGINAESSSSHTSRSNSPFILGDDNVAVNVTIPAGPGDQTARNTLPHLLGVHIDEPAQQAGPSSATHTQTGAYSNDGQLSGISHDGDSTRIDSQTTPTVHETSLQDFSSPKIVKASAIAAAQAAKTAAQVSAGEARDDEEDGSCCPICFEPWSNSGNHRLSSLKCGHLFGQSCIEKWLKGQGTKKCPQCNLKATKKDIRVLYARTLKMIDTTERDHALQDLAKERDARRKAEMEAASAKLRYEMTMDEFNRMKEQIKQFQSMRPLPSSSQTGVGAASSQPAPSTKGPVYMPEKTVKISEAGGCRVVAYNPHTATLCISQPSSYGNLVGGFGVKKLYAGDFGSPTYIKIHEKPIRDLAFNQRSPDGLLLSCSLDTHLSLTSLMSNTVVQRYKCALPLWSCCFNSDDANYVYAGQQNGTVHIFDVRNTAEHVQELNTAGSRSPVVSLQYAPRNPNASFYPGGLLVGQLDRSSFYELKPSCEYKLHALPMEGSLTSLSLEESSRHVLASYRPTGRHPSVRHQMSELTCRNLHMDDSVPNTLCSCHSVYTFHGGNTQKLLGRSRLIANPSKHGNLLVCAADEATLSVQIWNANTGQLHQKVMTSSPVLDMCPVVVNDACFLVTLTEKLLSVYKWR